MERLDFETLFRIVRWDYNRCFKDESLDKDLFMGKYGKVMGEHYYNKFVHEFDGTSEDGWLLQRFRKRGASLLRYDNRTY